MNAMDKAGRVITEILETEEGYVRDLKACVSEYVVPLREAGDILDAQTIANIFLNLEDLINVNSLLLERLTKRIKDENSDSIGDIFNELAPYLSMYKHYASNYEASIRLATSCQEKSKKFAAMCQRNHQENPTCRGLALSSFLIMPVQRIPRYKLLLEEVIKQVKKRDDDGKREKDVAELEAALSKIGEVASLVNEAIRRREQGDKLYEIQMSFTTPIELLDRHRVFLYESMLTKVSRKSHITYKFLLFNDLLIYARPAGKRLEVHRILDLGRTSFQPILDEEGMENGMRILSAEKSFIVLAESGQEKDTWLQKVAEAHGKLGVDPNDICAPVWMADGSAKECTVCKRRFNFKRRRHHCRKCGCLCCGSCSKARVDLSHEAAARVCDTCAPSPAGKAEAPRTAPPPPSGLSSRSSRSSVASSRSSMAGSGSLSSGSGSAVDVSIPLSVAQRRAMWENGGKPVAQGRPHSTRATTTGVTTSPRRSAGPPPASSSNAGLRKGASRSNAPAFASRTSGAPSRNLSAISEGRRGSAPPGLVRSPEVEGFLIKQGLSRKNWKKRKFVLDLVASSFRYYEPKKDGFALKGEVPLNSGFSVLFSSEEKGGGGFVEFSVVTTSRTLFLRAECSADADMWARAFKDAGGSVSGWDGGNAGGSVARLTGLFDQRETFAPREPLKKGVLTKRGRERKNWKEREFVLTTNSFRYYEAKKDGALAVKGEVSLLKPFTVEKTGPAEFSVVSEDRTLMLRARDEAAAAEWIAAFSKIPGGTLKQ